MKRMAAVLLVLGLSGCGGRATLSPSPSDARSGERFESSRADCHDEAWTFAAASDSMSGVRKMAEVSHAASATPEAVARAWWTSYLPPHDASFEGCLAGINEAVAEYQSAQENGWIGLGGFDAYWHYQSGIRTCRRWVEDKGLPSLALFVHAEGAEPAAVADAFANHDYATNPSISPFWEAARKGCLEGIELASG